MRLLTIICAASSILVLSESRAFPSHVERGGPRISRTSVEIIHHSLEGKLGMFNQNMEKLVRELGATRKRHEKRIAALEKRRDGKVIVHSDVNAEAFRPRHTWLFPFIFIIASILAALAVGFQRYHRLMNMDTLLGGRSYKLT